MDKNYSNDNYNLVYSDTFDNYKLHFAEQRRFLYLLTSVCRRDGDDGRERSRSSNGLPQFIHAL